MRVLVTGGSGFIGSHVVDKLRARGHEPVIYDLRPSPWHPIRVCGNGARLDHRPRGARAGPALLRRRRPPGRRGRRQRRPRLPRGCRAGERARDGGGAGGGAARRGQADRVRLDDLGVLGLRRGGGRRADAPAGALAPVHEHQARRRALLQGLPGALRDRLHDPALRDPVRAAGARGGGHPGVRREGAAGRGADAGRRREPVAEVRVRRGPGRRRRARSGRRRREPGLQPRQRRERLDQADRRDRARGGRGRLDRVHAGATGRLRRQGGVLAARARGAGVERRDAVQRGRPPLRGVAPRPGGRGGGSGGDPGRRARRRGRTAQGPDHLGRHRRGPRPSGPGGGARVQGRGPRRPGLDRQRTAGDGDRAHARPARELRLHVPLRALVVRLPIPAVHEHRADALDVPPAPVRARAPGPAAPDPGPRSRRDRLHLPGRDRCAR